MRVLDDKGNNLGVLDSREALSLAKERGLDLIEISPSAKPPVAKIIDYGKFRYEKQKKEKEMKAKAKPTETKSIQTKIGTAEDMLRLRAKKISEWLREGNRVKVELFLTGRSKYMDKKFLKEKLERLLNLITEEYKISEPFKKTPKGYMVIIEKA